MNKPIDHLCRPPASVSVESAQDVASTLRCMQEFGADKILDPLLEYCPDANQPLEAVLNICHNYNVPAEAVISVLIDVNDHNNPQVEKQQKIVPLDEWRVAIDGLRIRAGDRSMFILFGQTVEDIKIVNRPTPDHWQENMHSAAEWDQRVIVAESITDYLSKGAQRQLLQRGADRIMETARALEPYHQYVQECREMVALIEAGEQARAIEAGHFARLGSILADMTIDGLNWSEVDEFCGRPLFEQ